MSRKTALLITCEHGGNAVPAAYRALFAGHQALLATHRGLDIGALPVAKRLAAAFDAPLHYATVSRLVVELNRSPHHPSLYSSITKALSREERDALKARYYTPYRDAVEATVQRLLRRHARVLHLSIHSFTPELNGEVRNCELALLYDPKRRGELAAADALMAALKPMAREASLRLRRNYPYHGASDGFMTRLRRLHPASRYAGLEVEMNQGVVKTAAGRALMTRLLTAALSAQGF